MTTPDKLYISQLIYGTWQYQTPDPDDETQVEYIRKDALIEMLNKKLQESADRLDFHANQAYAEMIDKLNSL